MVIFGGSTHGNSIDHDRRDTCRVGDRLQKALECRAQTRRVKIYVLSHLCARRPVLDVNTQPTKHLQAIIFGGIGTLVETSELQREAFNRAFEEARINNTSYLKTK